MRRLLLALIVAIPAYAADSTRCQTEPVRISDSIVSKRLVGCGDGFAENVLWHLDRADGVVDSRVARRATGRGVVVYVIDSGVEMDHDEFQRPTGSTVIAGLDILGSTPCGPGNRALHPCKWSTAGPFSVDTHGTAVASVIGGRTTGIAPDARIVSVRMYGDAGTYFEGLQAIIRHAHDPATPPFRTAIINISGGVASPLRNESLAELESLMMRMTTGVDTNGEADLKGKRFLFVAAAGNTGELHPDTKDIGQCDAEGGVRQYPAVIAPSVDGIVSVGGITRENELWSGSCRGPLVEVLAPAESMLVAATSGNDHYRGSAPIAGDSGTSYATPYVAGVAATILEREPALTPAQLEERLKESAVDGRVVVSSQRNVR